MERLLVKGFVKTAKIGKFITKRALANLEILSYNMRGLCLPIKTVCSDPPEGPVRRTRYVRMVKSAKIGKFIKSEH